MIYRVGSNENPFAYLKVYPDRIAFEAVRDFEGKPDMHSGSNPVLSFDLIPLAVELMVAQLNVWAGERINYEVDLTHLPPEQHNKEMFYVLGKGQECPCCGETCSGEGQGPAELIDGTAIQEMICTSCGCRWNDHYVLTGYEILEEGEEPVEPCPEGLTCILYAEDEVGYRTMVGSTRPNLGEGRSDTEGRLMDDEWDSRLDGQARAVFVWVQD